MSGTACSLTEERQAGVCVFPHEEEKLEQVLKPGVKIDFAAKVTGIRKPPRAAEAPREGSEGKWLQFQLPFRKCHLCAPFLVLATKRDGVKHFAHICVRLLHNACAELEN